jgi:hypothetical protein
MSLLVVVQEEARRDDLAVVARTPTPQEIPSRQTLHKLMKECLRMPADGPVSSHRVVEHLVEEMRVPYLSRGDAETLGLPNIAATI